MKCDRYLNAVTVNLLNFRMFPKKPINSRCHLSTSQPTSLNREHDPHAWHQRRVLFLAQALIHLGQAIDRQQQQETKYQSTIVLRGKGDPEEPMTSG